MAEVDFADVCVRCGSCLRACHIFLATGRRHHAAAVKIRTLRKILKADVGNDADRFYDYAFECTGCRRCTVLCPFSVETASYVSRARGLLTSSGRYPSTLNELAETQIMKGENWERHLRMFRLSIEMLENQHSVRIPVQKEAEILYVPLQGAHTIVPAARIFNAVKESWTLSIFEASVFAFFLGDMERVKKTVERIKEEAERVNAREIVITECGHAYRVYRFLFPRWFGRDLKVRSIVEVVTEYLKNGEVEVKSTLKEPITYHDPCQAGRNGGLIDEPRFVLREIAEDFREMNPGRELNFCCGGGGGLVAVPELKELRLKAGKVKLRQIRETEAKIVSTICENCKTQLKDLKEHYGINYRVAGVTDLLAECI